ncbi:MAG: hypothetical protein IKL52_01770 [Candidatus Gastranaerophilales bacterium]|jgi:hypothetical protein|nr:hypothetical protein [Candidatus Gastranaerophilales bacterium]
MQSLSSKENFFIGLALSNSSSYDSSVCVLDRNSKIIFIDKFYFAQDIEYFFDNSPYVTQSIICASVPYDNKLLDGKWRIHSKNYKALGDYFKVNRNDWTNRISKRCCDVFSKIKERNINIIRADINQLRQAYGLCSHYLSRTSIDCKNLQVSLKLKYGFDEMPDNMLSASALEAILCAMFAMEYANNIKTKELFELEGLPVLSREVNS